MFYIRYVFIFVTTYLLCSIMLKTLWKQIGVLSLLTTNQQFCKVWYILCIVVFKLKFSINNIMNLTGNPVKQTLYGTHCQNVHTVKASIKGAKILTSEMLTLMTVAIHLYVWFCVNKLTVLSIFIFPWSNSFYLTFWPCYK